MWMGREPMFTPGCDPYHDLCERKPKNRESNVFEKEPRGNRNRDVADKRTNNPPRLRPGCLIAISDDLLARTTATAGCRPSQITVTDVHDSNLSH